MMLLLSTLGVNVCLQLQSIEILIAMVMIVMISH